RQAAAAPPSTGGGARLRPTARPADAAPRRPRPLAHARRPAALDVRDAALRPLGRGRGARRRRAEVDARGERPELPLLRADVAGARARRARAAPADPGLERR